MRTIGKRLRVGAYLLIVAFTIKSFCTKSSDFAEGPIRGGECHADDESCNNPKQIREGEQGLLQRLLTAVEEMQRTQTEMQRTQTEMQTELKDVKRTQTEMQRTQTEMQTELKDVKRTQTEMQTELKDVSATLHVLHASTIGHPEIINSSVVISSNDGVQNFGCGIVARSLRYGVIVVTALHVVQNKTNLKVRNMNGSEIPIKEWQGLNNTFGDPKQVIIDVAFASVENGNFPAVSISPNHTPFPGMQIWAYSLRGKNGNVVALTGRIVKVKVDDFLLITDVGGVPGFSGSGYVDVHGTLQVIHTGSSAEIEDDADDSVVWTTDSGNRDFTSVQDSTHEGVSFHTTRDRCMKAFNLSIFGNEEHMDACLLLFTSEVQQQATDYESLLDSCVRNWALYVTDISPCVRVFIDGNMRFKAECSRQWSPAASCFSLVHAAEGTDLNEARGRCRRHWMRDIRSRVDACIDLMQLIARNPRAKGVPAWVIESPLFTPVQVAALKVSKKVLG